MAEAMCGPANPLQRLKQQSTLDRSLQQDRLISRPNAAQGFRSTASNAGIPTLEFEAFQAGIDINQAQSLHQPGNLGEPSQASSWVSDFQRLNVSSPPPFQQQQQQQHAPYAAISETNSWAQNFLDQRTEFVPRSLNASPSPQAFQQRARYGLTGFQSSFAQPAFASSTQLAKGKGPMTEQFDEAAFERAFDLAREDMIAETGQDTVLDQSLVDVDTHEQSEILEALQEMVAGPEHGSMIHGSDIEYKPAVEPKEDETNLQKQHTDDELAATAQELLEKIEHNKTDKFKNSQFLGLMRKLRDREVRVEGDKMVETVSSVTQIPEPTHTHAHDYAIPTTHFPTCKVPNCDVVDHEFDHWESPYW